MNSGAGGAGGAAVGRMPAGSLQWAQWRLAAVAGPGFRGWVFEIGRGKTKFFLLLEVQ